MYCKDFEDRFVSTLAVQSRSQPATDQIYLDVSACPDKRSSTICPSEDILQTIATQ